MRIGQFSDANGAQVWAGAVLDDGTVVNLPEAGDAAGVSIPRLTKDLLAEWKWQEKAEFAVEHARETGVGVRDGADVEQEAPISDPQKVVGVGLNYQDHAEESGNEPPEQPVLFAKFPTTITGPDSTVRWDPEFTEEVDYEAELAVVIGREAREVDQSEAMDHVAGFAAGNDVSARDIQLGDEQWVRGKSLDDFAPIGPEIVTTDEIDDPHDLDIWAELNGERLQDSSTSNLIFGVDELVAFCSQAFTLLPGDVIYSGTPAGVGIFRDPPILLEDGDEITVGVEDVGVLTNHCAYK